MPAPTPYPGVYIQELPNSAATITAAPTSTTVFVGYVHPFLGECAENGKWGLPIRISGFAEYERTFGGLYASTRIGRSHVAYAVYQFFLNGGADAYVVGLQPQYFGASPETITAASDVLGTPGNAIRFTSLQLTDDDSKVTVTVRNPRLSTTGGAKDTADLVIAFSSHLETYFLVNLKSGDPNFIEKRLANSRLVKVGPENPGGSYPTAFGFTGPQASIDLGAMPVPQEETYTLCLPSDFEDVFEADAPLDKVDIFNILVLPKETDLSVLTRALAYCHAKRAFLIMDPPVYFAADESGGLPTIEDYASTMPIGANCALYFPYVEIMDPITHMTIDVPPSGSVAGIYARTDKARGVWKAPAGLEANVLNTTGVVDGGRMINVRQGILNRLGVNVLRTFPGIGTVIWGASTTLGEENPPQQWRYVPVRRMALLIEQTLLRSLGWVVFEPNGEPLWSAIRTSIEAFMLSLYRQGAFGGATPSAAFQVKCDASTTSGQDIADGIVNIVVGFRPLELADFVVIQIAQLAGQVQTQGERQMGKPFTVNVKQHHDLYRNYRFLVYFDQSASPVAGVSKVSGIERTSEVVEHREGGDGIVLKGLGRTKYEPITLERGVTHDHDFEQWANAAQLLDKGEPDSKLAGLRKEIRIEWLNEAGQAVQRLFVHRCWVSEFHALPDLDAGGNAIVIEHLTLENEGWESDLSVVQPDEGQA